MSTTLEVWTSFFLFEGSPVVDAPCGYSFCFYLEVQYFRQDLGFHSLICLQISMVQFGGTSMG